ncbi:MAG: 5'/3'-nucleotidase SurE [Bacteroidia bacterium]
MKKKPTEEKPITTKKERRKGKKPVILVCNDDGITAPGIRALVDAVRPLGELVVVAPDSPQSGMGHAITVGRPLRLDKVDEFKGVDCYQCSGTPADCIKLATDVVLHHKPDLIVSGINHGSNSSINVIYSGTLSAAMEGAIEGIPSVGFSLLDFSLDADMKAAARIARMIAERILKYGLPEGTLLNVNIPTVPYENLKGIKICRQASAKWEEEFDQRVDPRGRDYYWLVGKFTNYDKGEDTDEYALAHNYVSVVPVHFDFTAHFAVPALNKWDLNV